MRDVAADAARNERLFMVFNLLKYADKLTAVVIIQVVAPGQSCSQSSRRLILHVADCARKILLFTQSLAFVQMLQWIEMAGYHGLVVLIQPFRARCHVFCQGELYLSYLRNCRLQFLYLFFPLENVFPLGGL